MGFAKSRRLMGLDISATSVKLLEISGSAGKHRVEHYAVVGLPPDSVVEKQIADPEAVGEAIAKVVRKAGTRTKKAAIAVGGSSTITKYITLPAGLTERQQEQQIEVEAEQHIPFPIEEVSLDFQIVGSPPNDPESVDVLLAAARSDNVDSRVAALEMGGLEAVIVDLEVFALESACELLEHQISAEAKASSKAAGKNSAKNKGKTEPGHSVAVVDVGATSTSLTVLVDGRPVYTRDQLFGGQQLTDEIMQRYELSFADAGRMKKEGGLPEGYEADVLRPFMRDMSQQVNRAIQLYQSASSQDAGMTQIILAGGCASITDIDRVVQAETGIPTVIADPFANWSIAPRAQPARLRKDAPAMLIAAGLAMRAFD